MLILRHVSSKNQNLSKNFVILNLIIGINFIKNQHFFLHFEAFLAHIGPKKLRSDKIEKQYLPMFILCQIYKNVMARFI